MKLYVSAAILLFLSTASKAESSQKLWTLTKVYGLIKYYNNERNDRQLDEAMLRIVDCRHCLLSDSAFNRAILALLPGKFCSRYVSSAGSRSTSALPDFAWFDDDPLLSDEMKDALRRLVNCHDGTVNRTIKRKSIYIHNEQMEKEGELTRGVYVLGIMKYWNVVNYFFPYKTLMD